jgi:hypothetical protein
MSVGVLLGSVLVIFIIYILVGNMKKKAFLKGYKQAEFEVTANMLDVATWFGGCHITTYNVLRLFAVQHRNLGSVRASSFRDDILKINHEQRITDLSDEEYNRLTKKQININGTN